jgi:hypothetical protein
MQSRDLTESLGIDGERRRLLLRPVPDDSDERENAVVAVEEALLKWIRPEEPPQNLLLRAFAPGLAESTITPTDYVVEQMLNTTIASHSALMQKFGQPPSVGSPEDSSYRRRHRDRIRRGAIRIGLSAEEVSGFVRWASFQAAVFWSSINSYRMVAVHDVAHLIKEELELFRLMHVRPIDLGAGLLLPPVFCDEVLASFVPAVSARFRERLIYVGCAEPGDFPDEWNAEAERLLKAYLKLYTAAVGNLRETERERRSSGKRKNPQNARLRKDVEITLSRRVADAGLESRLAKVRNALLELTSGGHSKWLAGLLTEADSLQSQVDLAVESPDGARQGELAQQVEQLVYRIFKRLVAKVLPRSRQTRRLIGWLVGNSEPVSLDQVAVRFGSSRPNISQMLIHAKREGQRALVSTPACAALYLETVVRLSPSTRGARGHGT